MIWHFARIRKTRLAMASKCCTKTRCNAGSNQQLDSAKHRFFINPYNTKLNEPRLFLEFNLFSVANRLLLDFVQFVGLPLFSVNSYRSSSYKIRLAHHWLWVFFSSSLHNNYIFTVYWLTLTIKFSMV